MADSNRLRPQQTENQPGPEYATGVQFYVAQSIASVLDAWRLVFEAYHRAGLIPYNPFALHTHHHAASTRSVVVVGRLQNLAICSISAYLDSPEKGLPLDSVYQKQLNKLRDSGRQLLEIGLFADRRDHITRQVGVLLELMRYACYFGINNGVTDGIIGVHPHHAKFYTGLLGFEKIGKEKSYAAVGNHPVVLLRLDWARQTAQTDMPRGLRYFVDHPLSPETFAHRVELTPERIEDSLIGQYLEYLEKGSGNEAA